jgi:hypothetical protein
MKKILLLALLASCARQNPAEIIAKGQNPEMVCDSATTPKRKIAVTVCTVTLDKDKKLTRDFIAATSKVHSFQAFQLKTLEDQKAEAEAEAKRQAQPAPAPVAPPVAPVVDAGTGSASN